MLNDAAPPGKERKYALVEYERRFLLSGLPREPISGELHIVDRYVRGTRLRVRQTTETNGRTICKLTQKIPNLHAGPGLITTMYLDEQEYRTLSIVPAYVISKVRRRIGLVGVDEFYGPLNGLYLAEAEFAAENEAVDFSPPAFAVSEVTTDRRFTGGFLAAASREEIKQAAAEYGVALRSRSSDPPN
jgi:CYTH domain-containing protein